ncbi:MAG: recombinase family protein, partial [Pseudomonadota bacterium]
REKASGRSVFGRPELEKAIDTLGTGDVLVLAEWDRVTRSMSDGIKIIDRVAARGAFVKVLDRPYLDLTTPMSKGLLALLSVRAEDERQGIVRRAHVIGFGYQAAPAVTALKPAQIFHVMLQL